MQNIWKLKGGIRRKTQKKGTPDKGKVCTKGRCTGGTYLSIFENLTWCGWNEARNVGRNKIVKGLKYHDKGFEHYSEGMGNQ